MLDNLFKPKVDITVQRQANLQFREEAKYMKLSQSHMKEGNLVAAKIHAQSAITAKNQGINYLRFASKLDCVSSKLKSQQQMAQTAQKLGSVSKDLASLNKNFKIEDVSKVMDQFEGIFGDLDVKESVLSDGLKNATATSAPSDEVNQLMKQLIEENNLNIDLEVNASTVPSSDLNDNVKKLDQKEEESLEDRLKLLRE